MIIYGFESTGNIYLNVFIVFMDGVKYSQPFVSQLETIKDLMHGYYTSLEEHKKFTPGECHQSITILYLRD